MKALGHCVVDQSVKALGHCVVIQKYGGPKTQCVIYVRGMEVLGHCV